MLTKSAVLAVLNEEFGTYNSEKLGTSVHGSLIPRVSAEQIRVVGLRNLQPFTDIPCNSDGSCMWLAIRFRFNEAYGSFLHYLDVRIYSIGSEQLLAVEPVSESPGVKRTGKYFVEFLLKKFKEGHLDGKVHYSVDFERWWTSLLD